MATIKVKYHPLSADVREGVLYYHVTHECQVWKISSGYRVGIEEWNAREARVVVPPRPGRGRVFYLKAVEVRLRAGVGRLQEIITGLEISCRPYTPECVAMLFALPPEGSGFLLFARGLAMQLAQAGRWRTAETYTYALNSFARFLRDQDVLLRDVDAGLMGEYETYLRASGICPNTSSFYMRNLRAMYNRAVECELTEQRHPFRYVYTGIDKTVKRAVPLAVIRLIRDLDLSLRPTFDLARDVFMFSFYTRGMSFVDMAFLRKSDLNGGILAYRRRKTGQRLFVRWERPMQQIVDKYDLPGSPYLLPIIRCPGRDEWRQYQNASHAVNAKLKRIGQWLGLTAPLTTYVARHGWASVARSQNIPVSVISEAMGHDSEHTTQIYLASLDASHIDRANSLVLDSLQTPVSPGDCSFKQFRIRGRTSQEAQNLFPG